MTPLTRRRAVVAAAILAAGTIALVAQAPQPPPPGAPLISGRSDAMDGADLQVARRRFEAGARTFWHSHESGQLLFVEEGRMRTQRRGERVRELGTGESDYTGPNVVHWHGATPQGPFVQVNVGWGGGTVWLVPVTDAEYEGQ